MIIQLLITLVALFGLFGTLRRFKKGTIGRLELVVWLILWAGVGGLIWNPNVTNLIAGFLGVGRGADAVFYIAIVALFYTIFRLHGKIENLEHQLSELVKKIALKDLDK